VRRKIEEEEKKPPRRFDGRRGGLVLRLAPRLQWAPFFLDL
jgi:hypothetical protein